MKQFIYVLKLKPSLQVAENWTKMDEISVNNHFNKLKVLLSEKKLVLAGKTDGLNQDTFGLVILEVNSEEEAREVMLSDPAVADGVMTATLYPYSVALMR